MQMFVVFPWKWERWKDAELYSGGNGCELRREVYTCILMVTVHEMNRWYLREAFVFRFGITEENTLCDS